MNLILMLTPEGDESSIPKSDLQRYLNIGWKIADEKPEVPEAPADEKPAEKSAEEILPE